MIYVHLAPGFEEIEALTIIDVLRRAGLETLTVKIPEEGGSSELLTEGAHGISVLADIKFEEADYKACELIVLPGGMPGTKHLGAHKGLTEEIKAFAKAGRPLSAICAAPMVFGGLGLLSGKSATIYPGMEEYLVGAKVSKEAVVADGNLVTSRGPGTAMAFALKLVELMVGKEKAAELSKAMVVSG